MKRFTVISRIICLICVFCMIFSFAGCGNQSSGDTTTEPTNQFDFSGKTPDELQKLREDYLKTVTYHNFELTGENAPYFVGRWFDRTVDGITYRATSTNGSMIYFMTENTTTVNINFTPLNDQNPCFAYSIDGAEPVRQYISQPAVTLPDNGHHTVRIITDALDSGISKWRQEEGYTLKDITVPEGGQILGIAPKDPVIFYYGDSITEGNCALTNNLGIDGNSATHAYPWYCSEKLGVVPYYIGYGGSGITQDGSFRTMIEAIDYLSANREVTDTIMPDIIVINHGTNDRRAGSAAEFETSLTTTLTRLQQRYPDVPIVYMIPLNQQLSQSIMITTSLLTGITVVETRGWNATYTDGTHPDAAGAKIAGEKLADALVDIFGADYFPKQTTSAQG